MIGKCESILIVIAKEANGPNHADGSEECVCMFISPS